MSAQRARDPGIDAVGTESDVTASFDSVLDRVKTATFMGTDRPHVLRQAIHCFRNFGIVSILGVYGGFRQSAAGRNGRKQRSIRLLLAAGKR
jgi:threonine dehydrogenase-like Zn-dependent dehydrogenase